MRQTKIAMKTVVFLPAFTALLARLTLKLTVILAAVPGTCCLVTTAHPQLASIQTGQPFDLTSNQIKFLDVWSSNTGFSLEAIWKLLGK